MIRKFEEFQIGEKAEFKHVVTWDDIKKFVEITGDDNKLHIDREFASKTPFKGIVAHGMLSASFISTIIGKHIPGHGALWIAQSFNFLLPVRPNDELLIMAEVLKKDLAQRVLTLKTQIFNQHKQLVLDGEGKVKVLEHTVEALDQETSSVAKTIVVTGASRGIGAATSKILAESGFRIVVNYSADKEGAESLCDLIIKNKGLAIAVRADVSKDTDVEKMFKVARAEFGPLYGLVNNASPKLITMPFSQCEWDVYQKLLDVHLKGAFNCIKNALPDFIEQKSGSVVNLSSVAVDQPPVNWSGYVMAKSALVGMTKALAVEYGPKKIRFNIVSPGTTDTSLISEIPEKARLLVAAQTPLRRLASPEDVANAIEYLMSQKSKHVTGEVIRVCGGSVVG